MRDVYQRVGDELQRRVGKRYTDLQIEQAVLDRHPLTWRGQVLSLSDPLLVATDHVASEILNWLRASIDRSHELILVTGGGAPLMTGFVRTAFPDAEAVMIGEPQQANAHGYYRIARRINGGPRG